MLLEAACPRLFVFYNTHQHKTGLRSNQHGWTNFLGHSYNQISVDFDHENSLRE